MLKSRKNIIKIIEADLEAISSQYNKSFKMGLNEITQKHIARGTERSSVVIGDGDIFFTEEINKFIKDLMAELEKTQSNLNIKFRKSELLESKSIVTMYLNWLISSYSSSRESYLKSMNFKPMDNIIDVTRRNVENTITRQIDNLGLKNKEGRHKPEVIYQKKAYYISVLALIVSAVAIVVSIINN
jgi:hypothetical protein